MAFIAKNREGQLLFSGSQTSIHRARTMVRLLSVHEALMKAVELGYTNIIMLVSSKEMKKPGTRNPTNIGTWTASGRTLEDSPNRMAFSWTLKQC